jgi:hypothetical protein
MRKIVSIAALVSGLLLTPLPAQSLGVCMGCDESNCTTADCVVPDFAFCGPRDEYGTTHCEGNVLKWGDGKVQYVKHVFEGESLDLILRKYEAMVGKDFSRNRFLQENRKVLDCGDNLKDHYCPKPGTEVIYTIPAPK